jgi:hypothetical protein
MPGQPAPRLAIPVMSHGNSITASQSPIIYLPLIKGKLPFISICHYRGRAFRFLKVEFSTRQQICLRRHGRITVRHNSEWAAATNERQGQKEICQNFEANNIYASASAFRSVNLSFGAPQVGQTKSSPKTEAMVGQKQVETPIRQHQNAQCTNENRKQRADKCLVSDQEMHKLAPEKVKLGRALSKNERIRKKQDITDKRNKAWYGEGT